MKMLADTSDPRAKIPGFRGACHRARIRAFSSEVDTGSREENASKQESRAPFRFHRNGKSSSGGRERRFRFAISIQSPRATTGVSG
jgi:hypothetical protein